MFAGRNLLRTLMIWVVAVAVLAPATVARAEPSLADIERQLEEAGNALEDIVEAYNKVNEDLAATQAAIADLTARMQPLQANMEKAAANVGDLAVAAYKGSTQLRSVSLLLNAGSSGTFLDQLATLQQINRYQQRDLATYNQVKAGFDAEKKRLDDLLAAQNAQKADLEARRTKIDGDLKKLNDLKRRANAAGRKSNDTGTAAGPPPAVSGKAALAVNYARAQLGKPYRWGGSGPGSFDCSGLTMMAWKQAGVILPHNAAQQYSKIRHISRSQLAPGDLVVYRNGGHIGIYVGNNQIIHAPTTGDVVKYSTVDRGGGSNPTGYGRPG